MSFEDKENCITAYEDVRNDSTDTNWLVLKYDEKKIVLSATGTKFCDIGPHFGDDNRAYVYLRMETGDEMSKRAKFVFISWIGREVSPLKKAKVSIDKAFVKDIFQSFSVEFLFTEKAELNEYQMNKVLTKAGGANYGTGSRP